MQMPPKYNDILDYSGPTTARPRSSQQSKTFKVLVHGALILFFISLCVPSLASQNGDTPGYLCLVFGWMYWPSNLLLLITAFRIPAILRNGKAGALVDAFIYLASAMFVSLAPVLFFDGQYGFGDPMKRSAAIGFYMWAGSHWMLAMAASFLAFVKMSTPRY
jgi:hypothetical protein